MKKLTFINTFIIKKILSLMLIFIFTFSTFSFSDDNLLDDEIINYEFSSVSSLSTQEPNTYSKNILVLDRKTQTVLYEKNAYVQVAMASTTKIMTCIIALENTSLSDIVTVSKNAVSVSGSTLGLTLNMQISMNDLLYGLMLRSRK